MRFLHTSDWHLGRSLHRADLREAQAAFLDHLVETVRSERVDAVLVAGDVYDRAIPPVDAVALYEDALARLRATGARVILISGNHDSARRLGVNSALIDASGVHLRTRPAALADPVLLADEHGQVAVYGVPYLEPALGAWPGLRPSRGAAAPRARTRPGRAGAAEPRIRAACRPWPYPGRRRGARCGPHRRARARVGGQRAGRRGARGGRAGGRRATPSGTSRSAASATSRRALFDGFSYVALGHLHGRQTLARTPALLAARRCPTRSPRRTTRRGAGSSRSAPTASGRAPSGSPPRSTGGSPCCRAASTTCSPRASTTGTSGDFLAVTLTDTARPEGAMDRLRAGSRTSSRLSSSRRASTADPRSYRAAGQRAATT